MQSNRGVPLYEYILSSLSSQTGGSLLAGHMRWQHRPSLLCSSRHRFNKEKFVQHLFICKSRVWHSNAGSSRLRWVGTQVSWRLLTTPSTPLALSPLSHRHPLMLSTGAQRFLPRTSKRRQQSERLECRGALILSSIVSCIQKETYYSFYSFLVHLDFVLISQNRVQLEDV